MQTNFQSPASTRQQGQASQTLEALLRDQHSRLSELSTLLEQELTALQSHEPKNLSALLPRKLELLEALEHTDKQLAPHHATLKQQFQPQIDELLTLQTQCQQQNRVNGELLKMQQTSFNRLQSVLSQARGAPGMTYDQEGRAQNNGSLGTNLKA